MISLNDVSEYIAKIHNEEEKIFLENAIKNGKCKFDYDMELAPRQLAVIVPVEDFEQINKNFYGLYFLYMDGNVGAWLAENKNGIIPTVSAGSYRYSDSISSIIRKAIQNLNTCDRCGKDVGLANLIISVNKEKYCTKCK